MSTMAPAPMYMLDPFLAPVRSGVAAAVVAAELGPVGRVAVAILVELGGVLDLVLRSVDEHRLRVQVDIADHAGRQHHLLAENPRTGVNDHVARTHLMASFV